VTTKAEALASMSRPMPLARFKDDLRMILKSRGALRHDLLVRSYFWRQLEMIRGRDPMRLL